MAEAMADTAPQARSYRRKYFKMKQQLDRSAEEATTLQEELDRVTRVAQRIAEENTYLLELMVDLNSQSGAMGSAVQAVELGSPRSPTPEAFDPPDVMEAMKQDEYYGGSASGSDANLPAHMNGDYYVECLLPISVNGESEPGLLGSSARTARINQMLRATKAKAAATAAATAAASGGSGAGGRGGGSGSRKRGLTGSTSDQRRKRQRKQRVSAPAMPSSGDLMAGDDA